MTPEKKALSIIGRASSYNELRESLSDEQKTLLHKAIMEQQLITMVQTMHVNPDCVCKAWKAEYRLWLDNVVYDYVERYCGESV